MWLRAPICISTSGIQRKRERISSGQTGRGADQTKPDHTSSIISRTSWRFDFRPPSRPARDDARLRNERTVRPISVRQWTITLIDIRLHVSVPWNLTHTSFRLIPSSTPAFPLSSVTRYLQISRGLIVVIIFSPNKSPWGSVTAK